MSKGSVNLILGCMFAGKTTELLRRARTAQVAKKKILGIKYAGDTRYSEKAIVTHDLASWPSISVSSLMDVPAELMMGVTYITIDEGQFFSDIVPFTTMAARNGIQVHVAALDSTFERKPFGEIQTLITHGARYQKLYAVCMICKDEEATLSRRISNETAEQVIGGEDKYIAVCPDCFDVSYVPEEDVPCETN